MAAPAPERWSASAEASPPVPRILAAARLFLTLAALALAAPAAGQPPADPCAGDSRCRHASAAELFAAADERAAAGDLAAAEDILSALTQDPDADLRAEARFRLAAVRERRGDLPGAVAALRALLAEKPEAQRARLELGRMLALQGQAGAAQRELRRAQSAGLPADVARTVRRFSTALTSLKRRGGSVDMAVAADSNVNRSTGDRVIDTVIAPFELDPAARRQSGPAVGFNGELFSRDPLLGTTLLTRAGLHADLFPGNARFNDIQAALTTGPEIVTGLGKLRPAVTLERRWYGGHVYSGGYGGAVNWLVGLGRRDQLQLDGSLVAQSIRRNAFLDGNRILAAVTWDHAFDEDSSLRLVARGAVLDARTRPDSLHQGGLDGLFAHRFGGATVYAQAGYTRTQGLAPVLLFGRTRKDDRLDLGAGMIVHALGIAGFEPVVRFLYTDSRSTIALYDYRRARFELGLTREF